MSHFGKASGRYLVATVALIAASQAADKYFFSIVLEPLKSEFALSDAQLGALNGLAFALLCGIAGIPIARLAENRGRLRVIAGSITAWSLATAITAFATGFTSLFATRVCVGIGEAGCSPACQSLLAARFPEERRAGALSVMLAGNYVGIMLGFALGGVLIQALGWRAAFLILGAFGIVLAPVVLFSVREPPVASAGTGGPLVSQLAGVLSSRAIQHFLAMFCLMGIVSQGTVAWAASFYIRYYGLSLERVGTWLGVIVGGGLMLGSLLGGMITDRLYGARRDAGVSFTLWTLVVNVPLSLSVFVSHDVGVSLALLFLSMVVGGLPAGPIYAVLHELVELRLRAVIVAVSNVAIIAFGGFGPLLVGSLSDWLSHSGSAGLRIALISVNVVNVWVVVHAYWLRRAYRAHRPENTLAVCLRSTP